MWKYVLIILAEITLVLDGIIILGRIIKLQISTIMWYNDMMLILGRINVISAKIIKYAPHISGHPTLYLILLYQLLMLRYLQ